MSSLSLRLEQEVHRRSLSQSELKMQKQQVSVMRSSEKALKQDISKLLDVRDDLESQNQELRRSEQHGSFSRAQTKRTKFLSESSDGT